MSKTIDERVVSMQFDNQNFESNVRTTMSTLDKLKASLNLSGASKGLESIDTAAKNCNLSPIGSAVDSVKVKFSALQVAALTCLQNITNQAFNTAKSILNSLTIEPITTGFNEYELKMNSIQTIMASTGESLETVNSYLNELNKYSDETIYSFADMTSNIGKFTNAGIKLEDAVTAIKGIANEAALSGANANEASRAMYNFSQALSTGYVQRIDWKSIELANMATVEFKTQLLEQAVAMGTVTKNAEGMYKALGDDTFYNTSQMFIEAMDEQWLTSEVLIETLKDYADTETDIGQRATKAATEVKTFSHMMDTLKESAQSGWAQTWEIIIGDYDEGKSLWTSLNEVIGGWISNAADARNTMLKGVFSSSWVDIDTFAEKLDDAGISLETFEEKLTSVAEAEGIDLKKLIEQYGSFGKVLTSGEISIDLVTKALKELLGAETEAAEATEAVSHTFEEFRDIVTKTIRGEFGNGAKRMEALTEAGWDYVKVQELINYCYRNGKYDLSRLTDEQLRNMGITEEQSEVLEELEKQAEEAGISVEELVASLQKKSGRELVIESVAKIFEKLKPVMEAFKATWDKVFGDFPTVGEILTTLIENFAEFADNLDISQAKIDSMTTTLEAFFDAIKLAAIMAGGTFGMILNILKIVGNELDVDFWNMTETIAEVIIQIYEWVTTNNVLYDSLLKIGVAVGEFLVSTINGIKEWISNFREMPYVAAQIAKLSDSFSTAISSISGWLGGFGSVFSEFFNTLINMDSITFDGVISAIGELLSGIFSQIREVISGLDSPFMDLIDLIITFFAELVNGEGTVEEFNENFEKIKDNVSAVITPIGDFINKLLDLGDTFAKWISSLKDAENIPVAIGEGIGRAIGSFIIYIKEGIVKLAKDIWAGMTGVGTDGVAGLVNGLISGVKTVAGVIWEIGSSMIETICEVLGIQSPSVVMMAIGAFAILGLALGLRQAAPEVWGAIVEFGSTMLSKFKDAFLGLLDWVGKLNIGQILSVVVIAGMLAFVVSIVKIGMRIADAFAGITEGVASISKGLGKIVSNIGNLIGELAGVAKAKKFQIYAEAIKSLAIAIGILAASIAVLAIVNQYYDIWAAVGAIAAIMGIFAAFAAIVALAEKFGKISSINFALMAVGMAGMAVGISIIASAAKKLGEVPTEKLGGVVAGMIGFILGLTTLMTLFGAFAKGKVVKNIDKLGPVILRIGATMLMMAFAVKMLSNLDASQVEQGCNAIVAFGLVVAGLVAVTKLAGKNLKSAGNTILKIGGVFLIMAYVMKLMSGFTPAQIDQGTEALTSFGGIILATVLLMRLISLIPSKSGSKSGGGKLEGIGSTILQVAGALFIIAAAAKMLGSMEFDDLKQAGTAVVGIVAVIGVLLAGLNAINAGNLKDVGSTILMVAGSILLIAAAAKLLGNMPWQELLFATLAIAAFGAGIYFMIQNLGKIKAKNLKGIGMTLLFAAGAIAILATIASVIGFIPIDVLGKGVGAVAAIGLLLMGLIKVSEKAKDAKSTLIGISIAMAVLSAAIVAISLIAKDNPLAVLESTVAICLTLVVLTAALKTIGKTKLDVKPIATLAGVLLVLGGTLILLGKLDPWRALEAAGALSLALIAMSAALVIINKWGSTTGKIKGPQILKTIAVMAAVALAIGAAIAIIGQLDSTKILYATLALGAMMVVIALMSVVMNKFGSGGSVGGLLAMSVALLAIGAAMMMIASIPQERLSGVFWSLAGAMIALTLVLVALSAAFTYFAPGAALVAGVLVSMIGTLLATAVVILAVGAAAIMFAYAIDIVISTLPALATGLTTLITSLAGCSEHAWAFLGVCAALAVGLILLSVGIIVASVGLVILAVALAVVGVGLVVLGEGLLVAGAGAYVFAGGVMLIASAFELVAVMLPHLAEGFAALVQTLGGCSDSARGFIGVCLALVIGITLLTITAAIFTVGAALMSVGLVILSVGLVVVSAAIRIFAGALLIGAAAVYVMATALTFLGTCITDGLAAGVAAGIETVTAAVTGLAESVIGTICSLLGINSPSVVMRSLGQYTGEGFALGLYDSESDVNTAASGLAESAKTGLGDAGTEGGTAFNTEALSNMDLSSLFSGTGIDTSSLTTMFSNTGSESGDAFNTSALDSMDFSSILSGESIDTTSLTSAFGNLGSESGTALTTGVSDTASMQPTLDSMLDEISTSTPQFTEAGGDVLKAFGKGLTAASSSVTGKLSSSIQNMVVAIKGKWSNFYNAGSYLVTGFVNGITINTFRAEAAAAAMADAAYTAAKEKLQVNSPSKVFRDLGTSVPEGFALGISMLGGMISDSVDTMAETAIDGTRDVISRIADVIDADIDSQPMIRPVLDLSDVTSGVNSINGMFDMRPSVATMSNIGSISSMMNGRSQNGSNVDVVSAIEKLRKDLGNVGNTTYAIDGITYDDGSNISEAMRTIVRATKMGRRV